MAVCGQRLAPAALPPGKWPVTYCIGGWVGPRAGLDGCENFPPTGIRSLDHPARSKSLYRLSYAGPFLCSVRSVTGSSCFRVLTVFFWGCSSPCTWRSVAGLLTQRYVPEELNPKQNHCRKPKIRSVVSVLHIRGLRPHTVTDNCLWKMKFQSTCK
jgi:hypothetical protein